MENIRKNCIVCISAGRCLVARHGQVLRGCHILHAHKILNPLDVCEPFRAAFTGICARRRPNLLRNGRSAFQTCSWRMCDNDNCKNDGIGEYEDKSWVIAYVVISSQFAADQDEIG